MGNFEADIKGEASYVRDLSVDDISLIKYEDIASKRFICEKSNKLYTIQKKEFAFYQKYNIALPWTHWRESIYSLCSNRHLIPDVVAKS